MPPPGGARQGRGPTRGAPSRPAPVLAGVALVAVAALVGGVVVVSDVLGGDASTTSAAPAGAGESHDGHDEGAHGSHDESATVLAADHEAVVDGTRVTVTVTPDPSGSGAAQLRLAFTDAATGAPLDPAARPLVWADQQRAASTAVPGAAAMAPQSCDDKIRVFAQGRLGAAPDVDLNHYDILALNDDASISVIDPHADVGGMTQLSAMATLESPGEDWVLAPDGRLLFVSMPAVGKVAAVDTRSFTVVQSVDAGPTPTALALDPSGRRLWVTNDPGPGVPGGVSVIDTADLELVGSLETGDGPGRVAFTGGDAGTAVIGHRDGSLTVVEAGDVRAVRDLRTDGPITDVVATADSVYVAHAGDLPVSVLDARTLEVVGRLDSARDITHLAVEPGGRHGFAVSGPRGMLTVFDPAAGTEVKTGEVGSTPADVSFTDAHAYVRSTGSTQVAVLELAKLDEPGPLDAVMVNVGQNAPGEPDALALALAPVHGSEMLVANPADQYIYMYMPGMNAPMGGFGTYGRPPRAVSVIDRGLREQGPGVYTADLSVPSAGSYDLAVALEEPRVVRCFTVEAEAAEPPATREAVPVAAELVGGSTPVPAGRPTTVRLRLTDEGGEAVRGVDDVQVLATQLSGQADARGLATELPDGTYAVELTLPAPGSYDVRVSVPSRGVSLGDLAPTTVQATDAPAS